MSSAIHRPGLASIARTRHHLVQQPRRPVCSPNEKYHQPNRRMKRGMRCACYYQSDCKGPTSTIPCVLARGGGMCSPCFVSLSGFIVQYTNIGEVPKLHAGEQEISSKQEKTKPFLDFPRTARIGTEAQPSVRAWYASR